MSFYSTPLARTDDLVVQTMNDEILLYDTQTNQAHVLNQTAAVVWKLANGKRTVDQITQLVAQELRGEPNQELVWLALAQLSKAGLLDQPISAIPPAARLTRRQFIQQAAFAAVLIPVVKTISAPTAQQSASCGSLGDFCNSSNDCCFDAPCVQNECVCFVAGTAVLYADGSRRAIETVSIGDLVLARDEHSGVVAPQPVEKMYVHRERTAFTLDFGTSALGTTATHPFYTDKGWVKAIDLRAGMDCYLDNGSRLTVEQIEHPLPHPQTVYNLQVAGYHTYFVGAQGVWVHNRTTIQDIPTS